MSLHEQHSIPTDTEQEIRSKVEQVLKGTPFAPSSLRKLSGGTANFMYHAILEKPSGEDKYQNGVVIKQGEGYVALHPALSSMSLLFILLDYPQQKRHRVEYQLQRHITSTKIAILKSKSIFQKLSA
ncbi:hypothetical protein LB505_011531 [Fusarium chuoi]|nr:hypothetical protein LB505_011531 [Fusarium chuoi]